MVGVEPSVGGVKPQSDSISDNIWTITAAAGGLIVGLVLGLLLFAAIRNREKFLWWHCLSRRRYDFTSQDKEDLYFGASSDSNQNNYTKPPPPRPTTPPLTKLNPTTPQSRKITDSPILTKYTPTGRHRRSCSSGGFIAMQPSDQSFLHFNNIKHTIHVEETVSNSDRQHYGKNIASRQISKDYPEQSRSTSVGYHAKTSSLDFSQA